MGSFLRIHVRSGCAGWQGRREGKRRMRSRKAKLVTTVGIVLAGVVVAVVAAPSAKGAILERYYLAQLRGVGEPAGWAAAARGLGKVRAVEALPLLVDLAERDGGEGRRAASGALAEIAREPADSVEALFELLMQSGEHSRTPAQTDGFLLDTGEHEAALRAVETAVTGGS